MTDLSYLFVNLLPEARKEESHDNQICKFIIVRQNGLCCLVAGRVEEYPYHANLVYRFCVERGIPSRWERKPDLLTVFDEETEIQGGGWMEINQSDRSLRIYGHSKAYGRFPANEVNRIIITDSFFEPFSVTVE